MPPVDDDCPDGVCGYRPRPRNVQPQTDPAAPCTTGQSCPNTSTCTSNQLNEQLLDAAEKPSHISFVTGDSEDQPPAADKKGMLISILALLLSVPALIGACCWPALVIGIVSGTVSASARTLGHTIGLYITAGLMLLVGAVLLREVLWGGRQYAPTFTKKWGPFCVFVVAAILIMCEPTRHVISDKNLWPWCGNNPDYDRINSTDPYPPQCMSSATQYVCTQVCCVSTYLPTEPSSPNTSYAWKPPTGDFYPSGPLPGPFGTLRADGTVYFPPKFDPSQASMPYDVYSSTIETPLTFYETGAVNPLRKSNPQSGCKYGVNVDTGYCFLTNQSLSYEEQLKQLPLVDPKNKTSGHICACDGCVPDENFFHLSVVGVISSILCTYTGFILLAVAVGWNANILYKLKKIGKMWRELRSAR